LKPHQMLKKPPPRMAIQTACKAIYNGENLRLYTD
jgi:hypothetical protein